MKFDLAPARADNSDLVIAMKEIYRNVSCTLYTTVFPKVATNQACLSK